jgi:hypothetical protein
MQDGIEQAYDYYGCKLPKLPDSSIAVGMTLQIKVMNGDGDIGYHEFAVGLSNMEQLGMLESASDTVRSSIMRGTRKP